MHSLMACVKFSYLKFVPKVFHNNELQNREGSSNHGTIKNKWMK